MDRSVLLIILALISTVLLATSVGYSGWGCGSSPLARPCKDSYFYYVIGVLLLVSTILVFLAAMLLIIDMKFSQEWMKIAVIIAVAAAAILSLAALSYYIDTKKTICPFLATFGMALAMALFAIMVLDLSGE